MVNITLRDADGQTHVMTLEAAPEVIVVGDRAYTHMGGGDYQHAPARIFSPAGWFGPPKDDEVVVRHPDRDESLLSKMKQVAEQIFENTTRPQTELKLLLRGYQPLIGEPAFCKDHKVGVVESVQRPDTFLGGYLIGLRCDPGAVLDGEPVLLGEQDTAVGKRTDLTLYTYALAVLQYVKLDANQRAAAAELAAAAIDEDATSVEQRAALVQLRKVMDATPV